MKLSEEQIESTRKGNGYCVGDLLDTLDALKAELATQKASTAALLLEAAMRRCESCARRLPLMSEVYHGGLKDTHQGDGGEIGMRTCGASDIRALIPPDAAAALEERDATKDKRLAELEALLNTPEIEDFDKAVPLEAAHQILRWTAQHDDGKQPEDWFWLVGYLAGKALASFKAGNLDKAKHHCISTSAALRNWHAQIRSGQSAMRPGIEDPELRAAESGKEKAVEK